MNALDHVITHSIAPAPHAGPRSPSPHQRPHTHRIRAGAQLSGAMLGRGAFSLHFGSSTGAQGAGQALRPLPTLSLSQRRVQLRAEPGDKQPNDADLQKKFFSSPGDGQQDRPGAQQGPGSSTSSSGGGGGGQAQPNLLDNVNPYELGRQARRAFDDVWGSISSITSPTKSYVFDDILDPTLSLEEDAGDSNARTTVLVVGATGRVGRILIRKLLLRGYKVRALIRKRQGLREKPDDVPGLPSAVEVVSGDVGELADCQKAIKGVDKVIFCAAARSAFTGELNRVDSGGVANVAAALQDERRRRALARGAKHSGVAKREVADFSKAYHQLRWDITFVGGLAEDGSVRRDVQRANLATAEITETNNLIFSGALFNKGSFAEVGAELNPQLPGGDARLQDTEGLTLRLRAEGHAYTCVLRTADGCRYAARFPTRPNGRYCTIRLPWALFRAEYPGGDSQPPLDPAAVTNISIRYAVRSSAQAPAVQQQQQQQQAAPAAPAPAQPPPGAAPPSLFVPQGARLPAAAAADPSLRARQAALARQKQQEAEQRFARFSLEVDWIKALPSGIEPEFVLVSCAGSANRPDLEPADLSRILGAKRRGEEGLRASGLGYTIIRPGPLVDEPGGYKALVFDQGDRIGQSISAADVADICLRALHEPQARNKTFDVCYEFQSDEGLQLYELVASIPSTGSNYLASALSTLQKNT